MTDAEYYGCLIRELKKFREPGDVLRCVKTYQQPESSCQLCGKKPITEVNVLMNMRSKEHRLVGCLCIINYRVALLIVDDSDITQIQFAPSCREAWERIERTNPGEVVLDTRAYPE